MEIKTLQYSIIRRLNDFDNPFSFNNRIFFNTVNIASKWTIFQFDIFIQTDLNFILIID